MTRPSFAAFRINKSVSPWVGKFLGRKFPLRHSRVGGNPDFVETWTPASAGVTNKKISKLIMMKPFLLIGLLPTFVFSAETLPKKVALTPTQIVDKGQELLRGVSSSHAKVEMTLIRPTYKRVLEVESFNQGRDKAFLLIHKPVKEKGNRTLRIKQDIWTYTKDVERAIKIPFSMMHTSWMGSDFTYEDMAKLDSLVKDYNHKLLEEAPDLEKRSDYLVTIELTPKPDAPVVWGRVIWKGVVSGDGKEVIPVEEQDFSERGELVRVIRLSDIGILGGKRIAKTMTCEPLNEKKKGNKTIVKYEAIDFEVDLDPKIFTKETLERGLKR